MIARSLFLTLFVLLFAVDGQGQEASSPKANWYQRKTQWHGFDQFHFAVQARNAYLIVPEQPLQGNPWIWRARFPGYHAEMDVELVRKGFHLGYVDVAGLFGSPQAIQIGDQFYRMMTSQRGLHAKPALEGVSRGGLFVYNWTAENPTRVACIYCDTPVCDFRSWPKGVGAGIGSEAAWKQCLTAYGFSEVESENFRGQPIDHAKKIADAKIPLLHIVSESDRVVPPKENTYVLRDALLRMGHKMEVISVAEGTEKSNGHHFTHPEPQRVVEFIVRHSAR